MKKLNLQVGDVLVWKKRLPPIQASGEVYTQECLWSATEWDVIKINKKSILLQNWPTYEERVIKLG